VKIGFLQSGYLTYREESEI